MKNLLRTTLLSILLFFMVVFLGVKYHWITYLQDEKVVQKTTLTLPENTTVFSSSNRPPPLNEAFQPALIQSISSKSALKNMTKRQIIKACDILSNTTRKGLSQKELFVGNCVVSNYNETIQDAKTEQSNKSPLLALQVRKICLQQLSNSKNNGTLALELLTGVCISNHLSR